jgi:hypothetical protein
MKIEVDIDFKDGGQVRRFSKIFRHMSLQSCRDHAVDEEEALVFLNNIDKIISELRKDFVVQKITEHN